MRGYTLMEIALVLVIIGLALSGTFTAFFSVQDTNDQRDARDGLQIINNALINYAATHRTQSRLSANRSTELPLVRLPPERPYLPCPDMTGDGLEDRVPVDTTETVWLSTSGGECFSTKGPLPWKTLNVPQFDPWGNLWTYRVADSFSHAVLGFDEHTPINSSSPTVPLNQFGRLVPIFGGEFFRTPHAPDAVVTVTLGIAHQLGPSVICNSAPCPNIAGDNIIAGQIVTAEVIVYNPLDISRGTYTTLQAGNVIIGLPAVVVSHGRNGFGAFRPSGLDSPPYACTLPPMQHVAEAQNAYWLGGAGCNALSVVGGRQWGFVSMPRRDNFDDVVESLPAEMLFRKMRELGVFPAPRLPDFGD